MSNRPRLSTPTKSHQPHRNSSHHLFTPSPPPATVSNRETSVIKTELRHKLEAFLTLRREWDELVLSRGLGCVMKLIELEAEIEYVGIFPQFDSVEVSSGSSPHIAPPLRATFQHACFSQECQVEEAQLIDGYAWKQLCKMADHQTRLDNTLLEMVSQHYKAWILKVCKLNISIL